MSGGMRKVTLYVIVGAVALLLIFFSLSTPIITNSSDFSIYNSGWNGCSELGKSSYESGEVTPNVKLKTGGEMEVVQKSLTSYSVEPESSTMMLIGPRQSFTEQEADYIHGFLNNGGKVVLADDFGSGNSLLKNLDTDSRLISKPLLDLSFEKKPEFCVAYDMADHPVTQDISYVMLNKGTGLNASPNATSLLNSSRASWIDNNLNGAYDAGENRGKHPILSVEDYGEGELILLSDPSLLINSMLDKMQNEELVDNLLGYVTEGRENVIFDESHRDINLVYGLTYFGNYPSKVISFLTIMGAMMVTFILVVPGAKRKSLEIVEELLSFWREEEKGEAVTKVLNNHPRWDEQKLKWLEKELSESIEQRGD